jgi:hypothetical protein
MGRAKAPHLTLPRHIVRIEVDMTFGTKLTWGSTGWEMPRHIKVFR